MKPTKFVLLTYGGRLSYELSRFLTKHVGQFEIVRVYPPYFSQHHSCNTLRHVLYALMSRIKEISFLRTIFFRAPLQFSQKYIHGGELNSPKLLKVLEALSPGFILLMEVGIVSRSVLQAARFGVINSHPGLLPWVRGVDAVASSLLNNIALGATVHYVNESIDSGPIISRHLLPVRSNDTLDALKEQVNQLSLIALTDTIEQLNKGVEVNCVSAASRFKLYRHLSANEVMEADHLARSGRGKELYERWKSMIDFREPCHIDNHGCPDKN